MTIPSWMPVKQIDGFKLLDALNSLGIANIWYDSPEDNQIQVLNENVLNSMKEYFDLHAKGLDDQKYIPKEMSVKEGID